MNLRTLGSLALEGSTLRRPKPLLLLAYLVLEGKKSRRELADLFWMEAKDPRDSLTSALRRVNHGGTVINVQDDGCQARVACDALAFQTLVHADRHEEALAAYEGPFLAGLDLPIGEELEEWVFGTRERLANLCRQAHLVVARRALQRAELACARHHAELAFNLVGAAPLERHELQTSFDTFRGCGSTLAGDVLRRARALGLELAMHAHAGPHRAHGTGRPLRVGAHVTRAHAPHGTQDDGRVAPSRSSMGGPVRRRHGRHRGHRQRRLRPTASRSR